MTPNQLVQKLTGRNIKIKYDKTLAYRGVISYDSDFEIVLNPLKCTSVRQELSCPNKSVLLAVTAHECGHYVNWEPRRRQYKDELLAQLTALELCYYHNYEDILSWLIVDLLNWSGKGAFMIAPLFIKNVISYWRKDSNIFPKEHIKQLKGRLL